MKIKFTTILILFKCIILAQPILNNADINFISSVNRFVANPVIFTTGGNGQNQTWDYSNVSLTPISASQSIVVTSAPFQSTFTNSNLIVKNTTSNNDLFLYFLLSNSKLELLGLSNLTNIIVDFNSNPLTQFEFPFTYNYLINDSYSTSNEPGINNAFTIKYDAFGTLITPYGTYNNVFRTKRLDGIFPEYNWYEQNTNKVILSVIFGSSGITSVTFFQQNNLNISKFKKDKFEIYPNPTATFINLNTSTEIQNYKIFDLIGRKIKTEKLDKNQKIDVSQLDAGNYFIEVQDINNNIFLEKFIKSK